MNDGAKISKLRNLVFLKDVLFISLSAFGGPQMHIAMFLDRFVVNKNYITKDDLMELNSLCQILPGPTSTQTITAIGFKMGGASLAFLTLLIWIIPAAVLMTIFVLSRKFIDTSIFNFILPLSVGFVLYSGVKMFKEGKKDTLSLIILGLSMVIGFLIQSPWIFPVLIIFGGVMSSWFGNHVYVKNDAPMLNVKWANFTLFLSIVVIAAVVGALTKSLPDVSRGLLLFENTYRMGSLVFGGGNVLIPMIITEFVEFKNYLTMEEFNTGYGLLQGIPGPRFTIATYVNGMAMQNAGYGYMGQIIGCAIGTIAIFLPGTLLIFFVYPIWNQLKTYPIVRRSLDGIIAAAIGLVFSAAFLLFLPVAKDPNGNIYVSLAIIAVSFLLLYFTKIPSPVLVGIAILAGIFF
jgi:chromate transporter